MRGHHSTITLLSLVVTLLAGCASTSEPGKVTSPPKLPPAYPASQAVAVDPALAAAARKELSDAADSSDPFIRAHVMEGVQESEGAAGRKIILRGLADDAGVVRYAACLAAGRLRLTEAREPALQLLDDNDMNVRLAARFVLHRLGDTRFSHDLEKYARDFDPHLRANTVLVLGLLEEQSALKILRHMRLDRDPVVRLQVAEAMWQLGDSDALETLVGYTISHFPDDQMVALLALAGPRDQRVIEHLRGALVTDYPEINLVAARGMGMLGSDEGYGIASRGVKSTDPRQRYLAALAMGAIGRTDAQPLLLPLLSDAAPDVRVAAATAILQLH